MGENGEVWDRLFVLVNVCFALKDVGSRGAAVLKKSVPNGKEEKENKRRVKDT